MTTREVNELQGRIFCDNIANLRKKHNLSLSQMAKILQTTVKSLKIIESGKIPSRVSVRIAFNASRKFKCRMCDLFAENLGEV